jgi:hypothetical protein
MNLNSHSIQYSNDKIKKNNKTSKVKQPNPQLGSQDHDNPI